MENAGLEFVGPYCRDGKRGTGKPGTRAARVENAGHENARPDSRGGKRGTGKPGNEIIWNLYGKR